MVVKMQEPLSSIGVKKAWPLTKFLNHELNKLRGSGVLQNIMAISKQNCPQDEKLTPITLQKIVLLFTVFVVGGILSIIIFMIERAISNKRFNTFNKNESNQCNINPGRALENNEIGGQCNIDTVYTFYNFWVSNMYYVLAYIPYARHYNPLLI